MSNSLEILALHKIHVEVITETSLYRNELGKASCNHATTHKYSYTGHPVLKSALQLLPAKSEVSYFR